MSSRHSPTSPKGKATLRGQDFDGSSTSGFSPGMGQQPRQSHPQWTMQTIQTGIAGQGQAQQIAQRRYSPGGTPLVPELRTLGLFIAYEQAKSQPKEQTGSPGSGDADDQETECTSPSLSSGQEKRRAQNRTAQRAFRVRKIQKVKNLEKNLARMLSQHNELLTSYGEQENQLEGLREQISTLQSELTELRLSYGRDQDYGGMVIPDSLEGWEFDAYMGAEGNSLQGFDPGMASSSGAFNQGFGTWSNYGDSV